MGDLSTQSDEDLIRRISEEDKGAFAELFGRYAGRVKAFLLSGGTAPEDADEIAQEVMVAVWRKAGSFDRAKAAPSTWIFTIARNRRIDLFRRHARPEPDPQDPHFQAEPEPSGLQILSARELQMEMQKALASLPEDQQLILHASFFEGLSHGEIAAKHDIPLGTVKSRIRISFKKLRVVLGDDKLQAFRED